MHRVFIVYAPSSKEMAEISHSLEQVFDNKQYSVVVKSAEEAIMPDIAAADIVFFGSESHNRRFIHPDYEELKRSLQGINLAGRVAAVFSSKSNEILIEFKKVLNDSEISLYDDALVLTPSLSQPLIGQWVEKVCEHYSK